MGAAALPTLSGSLRMSICRSCLRALSRRRIGLQNSDRMHIQRRERGHIAQPGEQAVPLRGYYAEIHSNPLLSSYAHATPPKPAPTPPPPLPSKEDPKEEPDSVRDKREDVQEKARIVFGSRLAGPIERQARLEASRNIAGVLVPPRPGEPDNCCMSGCVNCVWDQYRDDLEEWAAKSAEAREKLAAQQRGDVGAGRKMGELAAGMVANTHGAKSMDEDAGASETSWSADVAGPNETPDSLFADIPVGIREFMKTEKMLKERHQRDVEAGTGA